MGGVTSAMRDAARGVRRDRAHRCAGRRTHRGEATAARRESCSPGRRGARRRRDRDDNASAADVLAADRSRGAAARLRARTSTRWRSRSGTVKVNLALDRLPEFRGRSRASIPNSTAARSCSRIRSTTSRAPSRTRSAGARRGPAVRGHLHSVGVRSDARAGRQARDVDVHAVGAARRGRDAPERGGARRVRRPRDRARRRARARISRRRSCIAR